LCNIQVQYTNGLWYSAEYSTFSISDEASNYRLTVAGYSGDAVDAMTAAVLPQWISDGVVFSTPDRDNDGATSDNCAATNGGGWWHGSCSTSAINMDDTNALWSTYYPPPHGVHSSHMLIRIN